MAFAIPDSGITRISTSNRNASFCPQFHRRSPTLVSSTESPRLPVIRCSIINSNGGETLRTCKNCKTQFEPSLNHPRACRFHTAHFGGETKRKFESVYTGGTMDTPDSGRVFQYWHCCGSEDPFDPGCTAASHSSYDD
ncbi:uncharacterized protein LOC110609013 [Manihot esculenta]|uniref:Uncharacterized protein n=1 Tax=Manihot esculenta TaxID=3983 RepID=A0A2C9WD95_MANES|nr:uncharacterized protein LOC110609013 [Manihot esculenta]XP_043809973.1 uncharacterized protein LOC110609013 [Manihot esculenta]XP_043809974.1 uncharacterized protein LOC110609013 [Manihot esculenta]OAY57139.1 hypothetical protein MANES_02G073800v8 [Manihot esculenta]